jgi:hypothetical protein
MWGIFALLDPDPDSEYTSVSTDLIESGSNPNPDWIRIRNTERERCFMRDVFTSEEPDSDGCDGAGEVPALQQAQAAHLTASNTWNREQKILNSCTRR